MQNLGDVFRLERDEPRSYYDSQDCYLGLYNRDIDKNGLVLEAGATYFKPSGRASFQFVGMRITRKDARALRDWLNAQNLED